MSNLKQKRSFGSKKDLKSAFDLSFIKKSSFNQTSGFELKKNGAGYRINWTITKWDTGGSEGVNLFLGARWCIQDDVIIMEGHRFRACSFITQLF